MANRNRPLHVWNNMKSVLLTATVAVSVATAVLAAQNAPARRFEVASVKVNKTRGGTTRRIDAQSLTYSNITLGEFIQMAYDVKRYQIDGPDWIVNIATSDR